MGNVVTGIYNVVYKIIEEVVPVFLNNKEEMDIFKKPEFSRMTVWTAMG